MTLLYIFQFERSVIILEKPSRIASKRGDIQIGRVLKGRFKKKKFFLSLKDLEKHMFICGATGTGKSNFLQNFLINFAKHHPIPFFLVEFKGEYHFL
ncbi:MAG: FtsK/SpoIIIE domain-containing protein, partial [Promethearchaeota archaeon]